MPLERKARVEDEMLTYPEKVLHYTPTGAGTKQLTVKDRVVRITNSYATTLVLPPVSEAAGLTFDISVTSATAAVTLTDFGGASFNDSINWEGDYTLDAAEDRICLRSNGREWIVIDNQIA